MTTFLLLLILSLKWKLSIKKEELKTTTQSADCLAIAFNS